MSAGSLDAQSACGKDSSSRRQMDNEASGKETSSAMEKVFQTCD
jgi:hypothetical protein